MQEPLNLWSGLLNLKYAKQPQKIRPYEIKEHNNRR